MCACTQAGVYIMTLFDWYAGGLNVIIIAFCEVCGISWIYGTHSEYTWNYAAILLSKPIRACRCVDVPISGAACWTLVLVRGFVVSFPGIFLKLKRPWAQSGACWRIQIIEKTTSRKALVWTAGFKFQKQQNKQTKTISWVAQRRQGTRITLWTFWNWGLTNLKRQDPYPFLRAC